MAMAVSQNELEIENNNEETFSEGENTQEPSEEINLEVPQESTANSNQIEDSEEDLEESSGEDSEETIEENVQESSEETTLEEVEESVTNSNSNQIEVTEEASIVEPIDISQEKSIILPDLSYRSYVNSRGWQSWALAGGISGGENTKHPVESIQMTIENIGISGTIQYRLYSSKGWNSWSESGQINGNSQMGSASILRVKLNGAMEEQFDVYYRVCISGEGWLDWCKNGEMAGTANRGEYIEGYQVQLVYKNAEAPGEILTPFTGVPEIGWRVQTKNAWSTWNNAETEVTAIGKTSLEAIQCTIQSAGLSGTIQYRVYVKDIGWQSWSESGSINGIKGESISAVQIKLNGQLEEYYDIYYCINTGNALWENWVKNGEMAGDPDTVIKNFQIKMVGKNTTEPETVVKIPELDYRTRTSAKGWNGWSKRGNSNGILGKSIEAVQLTLENTGMTGTVQYRLYRTDTAWYSWQQSGKISGNPGSGETGSALQIQLTGELAQSFDIYYRTYVKGYGWLGWAKNGAESGVSKMGLSIEQIQIQLQVKGGEAPGSTNGAYLRPMELSYRAYSQESGWSSWVNNGDPAAAEKYSALKAIQINLEDIGFSGSINYRTYANGSGWSEWSGSGAISGETSGDSYIEAVQVKLTGQLDQYFDIYYQSYVEGYGWLGWTKNGSSSGTMDLALPVESIRIKVVAKNSGVPGGTANSFIDNFPTLGYRTWLEGYGWRSWSQLGNSNGVENSGRSMGAVQLTLSRTVFSGTVQYRVLLDQKGWQPWVESGVVSGSADSESDVKAIEIRLNGQLQERYDIYYRMYVQDIGWLDWASNGGTAGVEGLSNNIEAIQIQLVRKGESAPGRTENPVKKALLWGIDVSAHQGVINWNRVKDEGVEFVMLRLTQWDSTASASSLIEIKEDEYLMKNITGAHQNNIKFGGYVYNYASNVAEATAEAEFAVEILEKYKRAGMSPDYPIVFDLEEDSQMSASQKKNNMAMAAAFCGVLERAGYKTMVYGSPSKLTDYFDYEGISSQYEIWLARYRWGDDVIYFSDEETRMEMYELGYEGGNWTNLTNVQMWQYSQTGRVSGINGYVDLDMSYKDY